MTIPFATRRSFIAGAASLPWALRAAHALAAPDWDAQPELRPVETAAAAADLIRGPHYTIGPTVTTFAYLNRYSVASDYGPFIAPSDVRLRRLIREIAAIAELKAMQQTDAFAKAAMEAGKSPFRSAKSLVDDPMATLSAIPEGIGSIFNRANEQIHRGGRSQYEDGPAKSLLAVSGYKREYAAKLGVDAYSSNALLQAELDRMAWASAAGNLTLGALSFATGALALQVASDVRLLEQARNVVEATPPAELSKRNRAELQRLKVPDAAAGAFLENRVLSPRHQTIIVSSMAALGGVPGTAQFIDYAKGADTEDAALLFQQMAELIASYSAQVAAVRRIAIAYNLPVVSAAGDRTAMLLPVDRLLWTERTAGLAQAFARLEPHRPEIWLTGDVSPRAEAGLKQLGLSLTERCDKQLPLLD